MKILLKTLVHSCNVLRFTFPQQPKDIDTPDGTIPSPQDIEKYINELQEFKYKYENDNLLILILNKDKDEDIEKLENITLLC